MGGVFVGKIPENFLYHHPHDLRRCPNGPQGKKRIKKFLGLKALPFKNPPIVFISFFFWLPKNKDAPLQSTPKS